MLRIDHLIKTFGSAHAVSDVSLSVAPGEIFALIGPNGAGKSTIIKTIVGLLRPTSGTIVVGGADVVQEPERSKAMIGYIPDEPAAWSAMTGEEFLHFIGALFPNFETDDPQMLSTSLPGLAFIFSSLIYGGSGAYLMTHLASPMLRFGFLIFVCCSVCGIILSAVLVPRKMRDIAYG